MGGNSCDILGACRRKNKRKMARLGLMEYLVAADKIKNRQEAADI
jgi:hypothetical protein